MLQVKDKAAGQKGPTAKRSTPFDKKDPSSKTDQASSIVEIKQELNKEEEAEQALFFSTLFSFETACRFSL